MEESYRGGGEERDGRSEQKREQKGGGGGGEWKGGDGSQFREINKRIRAIMNDPDGGSMGGGSVGGALGGKNPTRYYSDQLPIQKLKITPRDPRGISIAGGRGLGKFPAKAGGMGAGAGADKNHRVERGGGGISAGGSAGARRFSSSTSKVVPIVSPASPCSSSLGEQTPGGGGGGGRDHEYEARSLSGASTDRSANSDGDRRRRIRSVSSSTDDGRWPVVNGIGVGGGSRSGKPKPPMPCGPPPANARGRAATDIFDSKDDVGGKRSGSGDADGAYGRGGPRRPSKHRHSGGGYGKKKGFHRRTGPCQTRSKGGGAEARDRWDRQPFGILVATTSTWAIF